MTRSFFSLAMQAARAAERSQRAQIRERSRQVREYERATREQKRIDKRSYIEERAAEVDDMNQSLVETIGGLEGILSDVLAKPKGFDWKTLERQVDKSSLDKIPELRLGVRPDQDMYLPKPPDFFGRLLPGWKKRHDLKVSQGHTLLQRSLVEYTEIADARQRKLELLQAEVNSHNQEIKTFFDAYRTGNAEAVCGLFDLIFERSEYPEGFSANRKVLFLSESKQLIVDIEIPVFCDIVPLVEKYKYIKSSDQISETKKNQKVRQTLYSSLVSQIVLRHIYEIFASDTECVVDVVAINAFVDTIDPSSGQHIRPCLVSVRTTRDEFKQLDLRYVEPLACLKRLNASVSRSPSELAAVRPIVDINMVDPRFVQEDDILSGLDARPNLMELTPGEFESLITNLFQRMGLETKLTQASRDGGVDCVAFDPRPVLGGKVIVQAKRYKNTVGVSAVRDLFGTMHNEGASKGILVTTSGYGKAAFNFANGKPLELISGSNLLYMLKEHAGIDAKIIVPDDWRDLSAEEA